MPFLQLYHRNLMRKIITFISLLIGYSAFSIAQDASTDQSSHTEIFFNLEDGRNNRFIIDSDLNLIRYSNLSDTVFGKLSLTTPDGNGQLRNASVYNENIVVVFSIKGKDNYYRSYFQWYDSLCQPISQPKLMNEVLDKKFSKYTYITSANGKFLCAQQWSPNESKDSCILEYAILDLGTGLSRNGKGLFACPNFDITKFDKQLSTNGIYIVGFPVYVFEEPAFIQKNYTKYVLHYDLNGEFLTREIPLDNLILQTISLQTGSDNNKVYLSCLRLDSYPKPIIVSFELDLSKEDKAIRKNKPITFDTFKFEFRNMLQCSDGSVVFLFERLFGGHSTTMSTNAGTASTTPKDYFTDILCFKVSEGEIVWNMNIEKNQVFLTNGSLSNYGSFQSSLKDKKLFIFFNDNLKNYDENNQCIVLKGKGLKSFKLFTEKAKQIKEYGVAMAEVDLKSGAAIRKLIVRDKGIVSFRKTKNFTETTTGVVLKLYNGVTNITEEIRF